LGIKAQAHAVVWDTFQIRLACGLVLVETTVQIVLATMAMLHVQTQRGRIARMTWINDAKQRF
jgi:hypothetical protein